MYKGIASLLFLTNSNSLTVWLNQVLTKTFSILKNGLFHHDYPFQNYFLKYGAKHVTCTWRSNPMGFKWPETIDERPLIQKFDGKTCTFKDGSTTDVDAVIMCTGYLHSYPYLEDNLRLRSPNCLYPNNLYKGMVWMGPNGDGKDCGENKLLYVGKLYRNMFHQIRLIAN